MARLILHENEVPNSDSQSHRTLWVVRGRTTSLERYDIKKL